MDIGFIILIILWVLQAIYTAAFFWLMVLRKEGK